MRRTAAAQTIVMAVALSLMGCAGYTKYQPPRVLPDDTQDIPEPSPRDTTVAQNIFELAVVYPTATFFDFARHIRSLGRNKLQALNMDTFGGVKDSSWFKNRNAKEQMSLEEIARGPDKGAGPETEGPWKIVSAKVEGFTPGFNIIDARGDVYVLKFDPYGYQESSSAAEVITGKTFYAAGYFVPENYIVYFDPAILRMEGPCMLENEKGVRCELTTDDFDRIMQRVEPLPDGRIRAVASKFLSGKPLGGFRYHGRRSDDPNDIIDHEHRRELRGMYVMCAWLYHLDIKDSNSLDVYVKEDGRKYIRHYLMDFGTSLGASPGGPMDAFRGAETDFDLGAGAGNLFTLGLDVKEWEKAPDAEFPSIGRFSALGFEPGNTAMYMVNPAFSLRTDLDCYWGAKLVMSFSNEQLEVLVREGQYSDPAAEAFLLDVLKQRRDMTGRYWFSRINCLDDFTLDQLPDGYQELRFVDLGVAAGFWTERETRYRCNLRINDTLVKENYRLPEGNIIPLANLQDLVGRSDKIDMPVKEQDQWEVSLAISRDFGQNFGKWVKVYLKQDPSGKFRLLGLKRQD